MRFSALNKSGGPTMAGNPVDWPKESADSFQLPHWVHHLHLFR